LVGLPIEQLGKLESVDEFDILVVDSVYDYNKKGGLIVSQDPQPGSKVKPGRTIYISVIAYLPEQVKMPSLVDLSLRQAKALLQTYGMKLGFVKMIPDPAKNAVLQVSCRGRNIAPGTMIPKGSIIDIYVGSGTGGSDAQIPFLIGKSRTEAISVIVRLGMMLGEESYSNDADSLNGRVYTQTPVYVYGKKIPIGSTINLSYRSAPLSISTRILNRLKLTHSGSTASLNNLNVNDPQLPLILLFLLITNLTFSQEKMYPLQYNATVIKKLTVLLLMPERGILTRVMSGYLF
jgi:beta-lactam-binding protein with PASTA domain